MVGGERSKEGERRERGRGKGAMEGTRTFLFLSRDLARAGWRESVCVGLGMKRPMMMRSDQEIPFPRTYGSLNLVWGGGQRVEKLGRVKLGLRGWGEQGQRSKSEWLPLSSFNISKD